MDHYPSSGNRVSRSSKLKYGPHGADTASGSGFLPNFQALMDCLDDLFRRYTVRHARALRRALDTDPQCLSDSDILQLVLDPVSEGRNTKPIAEALLRKFLTFDRVVNAPTYELMTVGGIGEVGAAALQAIGVGATHMLRQAVNKKPILCTSKSVKDYLIAKLQHERIEICLVLYLDSCQRLIKSEVLSRGTVDRTPLYPREMMRRCLQLDAAAIIVAHNHPSGSLEVSYEDRQITEDIVHAALVLGITVVDHVIIGRGEALSMREHDMF